MFLQHAVNMNRGILQDNKHLAIDVRPDFIFIYLYYFKFYIFINWCGENLSKAS